MRILFFNYEYPPLGGGAANATAYILKEFSKIPDLEVDLVTSSVDGEYHLEKIGNNIKIHKLPITDKTSNLHFQSQKDLLIYSWKAYFYAKKLIKKTSYDLTHSFFTVPCGFLSWRILKKYNIPYIVSLRGADVPGYAERFSLIYKFLTPLIKKIWKDAQEVISNSQGLKELALKSAPKQRINLIYNGIDTEEFKPDNNKKDKDKFIITPGASRINSRKGFKYLIKAVAILSEKYPQIFLEFMGDGDERGELEKLVESLGIKDKINFIGSVPHAETVSYYQRADVFVLSSLNEGMSNAMLEALATGLPIISTRTGGAEELVEKNENGFFIEMKNSQDIANKLEKLIENSDLQKRMSQKSLEKAKKMSWGNVAKEYINIYNENGYLENGKRKTKKVLLKLLVAIGFITWLIYNVDWKEVLVYFRQIDLKWVIGFILLYTAGLGISTLKWKILTAFKGFKVKYWELFKIYLTGAFLNNFFPSIVGGDTYRSYSLGKIGNKRYLESTSTVLIDRITGFVGVMVLILFFSLTNLQVVLANPILWLINSAILGFFLVNIILAIVRKMNVWNKFKKIIPEKILKIIKEVLSYQQKEILSKSVFFGMIFNFFGVGLATWMLFLNLHIPISFTNFMIVISISSIISSIPISIGNIGIKEWAFITFFGIFGVSGEAAISIAIFGRFLQMFVSFFALPFYIKNNKVEFRENTKNVS